GDALEGRQRGQREAGLRAAVTSALERRDWQTAGENARLLLDMVPEESEATAWLRRAEWDKSNQELHQLTYRKAPTSHLHAQAQPSPPHPAVPKTDPAGSEAADGGGMRLVGCGTGLGFLMLFGGMLADSADIARIGMYIAGIAAIGL